MDKNTGEIYGQYIRSTGKATLKLVEATPYQLPSTTLSQRDLTCSTYANPGPTAKLRTPAIDEPRNAAALTNNGHRRGPKPKVRPNPVADIIWYAVKERTHWIENAVMAGVYITAGSSNGKLNIRPAYVRHVITMPVISTEQIALNPVFRNHDYETISDRYTRYLASAGRVAVGHIERYLEQHPYELQRIKDRMSLEDTWGDGFDLDETEYSIEPT